MRLTGDQAQSIASAVDSHENGGEDGSRSIEIRPCSTCGSTTSSTQYTSLSRSTAAGGDASGGKQVVLCPSCYSEGRFPSTLHSGDFIKLDLSPYAPASASVRPWTDQETLLLLEGLEMHDDDWDRVASHVGSRTKDECIAHFLALPIEDPFLEQTQRELGPLQYARVPVAKEENPVTSVMAFLAETVGREVAAQAAGESVEALERKLRKQTNAEAAGTTGKKEQNDADVPADKNDADGDAAMGEDVSENNTSAGGTSGSSARQNVAKAATVALGSAAAKAHLLALEEDASLHTLVTSVVEAQVRKLSLKLAHFEQLEQLLEVERRAVELQKQQLYEDRLAANKMIGEVRALWTKAKEEPRNITQEQIASVARMAQGVQAKMPVPVAEGTQGEQQQQTQQQPTEPSSTTSTSEMAVDGQAERPQTEPTVAPTVSASAAPGLDGTFAQLS